MNNTAGNHAKSQNEDKMLQWGKGLSHCWLLFRNEFLALNVPFQFGLGQEVINTIKKLMENCGLGQKCVIMFCGNAYFGEIIISKTAIRKSVKG